MEHLAILKMSLELDIIGHHIQSKIQGFNVMTKLCIEPFLSRKCWNRFDFTYLKKFEICKFLE